MMTPFKIWRTELMKITQGKAADILGLSVSQVKNLDSGTNRGRDVAAYPTKPILKLMNAATMGHQYEPWKQEINKGG
jgi:hypothetical protein